MAENFSIRIEGTEDLVKGLQHLEERLRNKIMVDAVRVAAKQVRDKTKSNLRAVLKSKKVRQASGRNRTVFGRTGSLERSIKYRIKRYRNTGSVVAIVGPSRPEGSHGHLLEFGTAERFRYGLKGKKVGRLGRKVLRGLSKLGVHDGSTGRMPARPFLRPAISSVEPMLTGLVRPVFVAGIESAAREALAKSGGSA